MISRIWHFWINHLISAFWAQQPTENCSQHAFVEFHPKLHAESLVDFCKSFVAGCTVAAIRRERCSASEHMRHRAPPRSLACGLWGESGSVQRYAAPREPAGAGSLGVGRTREPAGAGRLGVRLGAGLRLARKKKKIIIIIIIT